MNTLGRIVSVALMLAVAAPLSQGQPLAALSQSRPSTTVREFTISARRYAFTPARIEVNQGDVVKITLVAEDVSHAFTIDDYRIAKKVTPAQAVTIEFCADRPGRFVFYCGMTEDGRCREMRGELIVHES